MKDVEETVQLWISGAFSRFRPPGCVECVMFGFSRNTPGESIGNMMETMENVTVDFVLGACSIVADPRPPTVPLLPSAVERSTHGATRRKVAIAPKSKISFKV